MGGRPLRAIAWAILLTAAWIAQGGGVELKTDRFRLRFGDDGRPASLRTQPGDEELLDLRNPGPGFFLTAPDGTRTPLNRITLGDDGVLRAQAADGLRAVGFRVHARGRYLALYAEEASGLPMERGAALHFELNGKARMRVTELDYMTRVQNEPYGVRAHGDDIWHQVPGEPLGAFALFVREDEADEDETLLHIWVDEKQPHPNVKGAWTLERARAWVAEWQKTFASRSQMIVEGESLDELRAALPWAEKARIDEIYLFTQTWRTDNFWPGGHGNLHVNRAVFPRGEEDLRSFSDEVRARGMRLNLHYVSGGIGRTDPVHVGAKPDRRLAGWVNGTLARPAASTERELTFQPPRGAAYPPKLPALFEYNHIRIEDEIVQVGSVEKAPDGTWLLHGCRRGLFLTQATNHAAGAEAQGLVVAYGQNYVPDNGSTLLEEMATNYAGFINRCGISHAEYDGAEIHTYNGRWGYRKFATRVYEQIDHPVTAHDSSGNAPRCNFEYRFNGSQRILRGTCRFTHGNWSAPVELASPGRVASTTLDADFVLSQGHRGGAMGLCKPEPTFAVSDRTLRAHGLSEALIETLLGWKAVSARLTDEQRDRIDGSFGRAPSHRPEGSRHAASRFVQTVRKTAGGHQIVPVCVMTRRTGDILWQQGQEHGAISPRQYVKPGESLTLENPFAAQLTAFTIRVLWGFAPRDSAASNLVLQPPPARLRVPTNAPRSLCASENTNALCLRAENPESAGRWPDLAQWPEWNTPADLTGRRGIGMRVTGDGSGALLLFMIAGRDYVVPIDFTGTRDVEIPNGEVAWASGDWGWRMSTKQTDYAHPRWCRLGFGYLPPHSKPTVHVEGITALAELPTTLRDPVIRTGSGTLAVRGSVASGQYLRYQGGETAGVYDENWNKLRVLPVEKKDYVMPAGWAPVSVEAAPTETPPWLEVQFMVEGEPMSVPAA